MSVTTENQYVWVMEWSEASETTPRRHFDAYSIEPQAEVRAEDFEQFMIDEMFPVVDLPVDTPSTQRRYVVRHYLLKLVGAVGAGQGSVPPDYVQDESTFTKFFSLSTTTATHYFDLVGSCELK